MNSNPEKDDRRPIIRASSQPQAQQPVGRHSRFQSPASQSGIQSLPSRFSSPATQITNNSDTTHFYNPPSLASPLPKEFKDRWRVVSTSSGSGSSTSDRTTSIESASHSARLKRKHEAITGNASRNRHAASASHTQHAPVALGSGPANRVPTTSSRLPVQREASTTSISLPVPLPSSPLQVPLPTLTDTPVFRQFITNPRVKTPSTTNPNTSPITLPETAQPPSDQTSITSQSITSRPFTSRRSDIEPITIGGSDGLINGSLGPPPLGRGKEATMPLWPLPQGKYHVGAPTIPTHTQEQQKHSDKRTRSPVVTAKPQSLPKSHAQSKRGPVPTCRRHPKDGEQNGESDCDSDCFEEYDPFDDVSDLREALEKQEKTKGADRLTVSSNTEHKLAEKYIKARPDESRRPYLSSAARSYFRNGNIPHLDSMVGHQLHVSFSEQEARRVWRTAYIICLSFAKGDFSVDTGIKALRGFLESSGFTRNEKYETLSSIASEVVLELPRRSEEDIYRYITEVISGSDGPLFQPHNIGIVSKSQPNSRASWSSLILARQCAEGMWGRSRPASHAHVQRIGSRKCLRLLQPFRTFAEGSSDVVDCAWDSSGQDFALACTTYNDMYNRVGNLMLGSVDGTIKFLCGHKTIRSPNQDNVAILDPYLHSTVSSVDFSGDQLFSSSFDNTVKVWGKKDRLLRKSLAFGAPVVRMKMSGLSPNVGTVCLQNGNVVIFRSSDEPYSCHVLPARQDHLEPASVVWVNGAGARKGWVFVGYENKESDKRQLNAYQGDLRLFDAEHGKDVQEIRPGSTRQFDISLDESGSFLITASIVGPARAPTPDTHSFVRVFDIERSPRKTLEFSCRHRDINNVTMSPCRRYVTSSGTNGQSYLWDVRREAEPLHELGHGDSRTPLSPDKDREDVDTGVTFASWVADGGLFVTGSSDGIVKVWDPARAEPFLYDLATFDDPVMTGAFSPDGDCLMIGETTGKATLLSYMGRHGPPEPFVQDRTMLAPIASEA
ncbi:hypothetical protein TWF730_009457 [Orbilia blumenaviensis]|uniref:Uncharacterized protein n=1 Tax=Orbilia blumenaviensis TaxID=1796055 RepID=A0AAV9UZL0_9PEZI